MTEVRQAFGIPGLDRHLGGGLRPGTLTVIAGATGAGKTYTAAAMIVDQNRGVSRPWGLGWMLASGFGQNASTWSCGAGSG